MGKLYLKKEYCLADDREAKQEFIRDFIKFCREVKRRAKEDGRGMTMYINKFVGICGESWQFQVSASADTVWTEATFFDFDSSTNPPRDLTVHYPKTKWGKAYSRWDTELREFLNREICKQ